MRPEDKTHGLCPQLVREVLADTQHITVPYRSDPVRIRRLGPDSGGSLGGSLEQMVLKGSSRESSVVVRKGGAGTEDPEPSRGFRVSVQCTNSLVVPSMERAKLSLIPLSHPCTETQKRLLDGVGLNQGR